MYAACGLIINGECTIPEHRVSGGHCAWFEQSCIVGHELDYAPPGIVEGLSLGTRQNLLSTRKI